MDPRTLFALTALALSLLGGIIDGLRLTSTRPRPDSLAKNKLWHRLQFVREGAFALALSIAFFGWGWAAAAGLLVYAAFRWPVFDTAHAVTVGREPLADGQVADTDLLLARLPWWGRLALYFACVLGAATWLYRVAG